MANLVPVMTSNTAPSGVASAGSGLSNAWKAFDDDIYTHYVSDNSSPQYVSYQFSTPKRVTSYILNENDGYWRPKEWTFEGSNDGNNWVILDTHTDIMNLSSITRTLSSPSDYSNFRLNVSSGNYAPGFKLGSFKIIGTEVPLVIIPRVVNYWSI